MGITKAQQKQLKLLGQKLAAIRKSKGLTLKELGYKIDKDPQSIHRVEKGDVNPTFLYLLELCKGLEVELSSVFEGL